MTERTVVDVSRWQSAMSFAPYDGVIIKAGGADGGPAGAAIYRDPMLETHYGKAKQESKPTGFYWFADLQVNPIAQADEFVRAVGGKENQLCLWLDLEMDQPGFSDQAYQSFAVAFLGRVAETHPMRCGIYTGAYTRWADDLNLVGYPLWLPAYVASMPTTRREMGDPVLFWQYTDRLGGLNLDGSRVLCNDDQWKWLVTGKTSGDEPGGVVMAIAAELPNITAADHTHPEALAMFRTLCGLIDKANTAKLKTDKDWLAYTEQIRTFFKVTNDAPGRIGVGMWSLVIYLAAQRRK